MSLWPEHTVTQVLLAEIGQGKGDAVNRLLERHRASVRKLIQLRLDRQIARRVDASDIVQDVLFEANSRMQEYLANPCMPFHLWLRHLAKESSDRHAPAASGGDTTQHRSRTLAEQSAVRRAFVIRSGGALAASDLTPPAASIRKD